MSHSSPVFMIIFSFRELNARNTNDMHKPFYQIHTQLIMKGPNFFSFNIFFVKFLLKR